jgi:hypothetical protein
VNKLDIIETLQIKELKTYEKFFILAETQSQNFFTQMEKPDKLSKMLEEKKKMMLTIDEIEKDLGPLRKEVSLLSKQGDLESVSAVVIERIKSNDMHIIEIISKISRIEQKLSSQIKNQMDLIRNDIKNKGNKKKLINEYGARSRKAASAYEHTTKNRFESLG